MIGKFTLLDVLFAPYFLFLFPQFHPGYGWLDTLVGLLLFLRIVKNFLPPPDKAVNLPSETGKDTWERDHPLDQPPPRA